MRPCFTFKASAAGVPAVLAIDDEIGFWGVQAKDFRDSLNSVAGNDLNVEINSPGGDVFAGLGMYNMIRNWASTNGRTVTTMVTGVAASIASIIMLAGDKRMMPKNTFAMVHNPSTFAMGTAEDLRDSADTLDKIGASLRNVYVDRMGMSAEAVDAMMAKDTWLTADECLANGFATDLTDAVKATAKFNMARADLPANIQAVFKAQEPTAEEVAAAAKEKADADAAAIEAARVAAEEATKAAANPIADQIAARAKALGLEAHSVTFALACTTLADAELRMSSAREIVALCAIAKRPDDAVKHIRANKLVADVRAELVTAQAAADVHISNVQPNTSQNASPGVVDTTKVWATHAANRQKAQQTKKGR